MMRAPMHPDPTLLSPSFDRVGGMASRIVWVLVLVVDLAGCGPTIGNGVTDICLEQHPGDDGCCAPDGHLDHGICCPNGSHAVSDFEHADWSVCVWDAEAGADAALDAGADAQ
jgi:hypothetical protein